MRVNRLSSYLPKNVRENFYLDTSGSSSVLRYRDTKDRAVPRWIVNSRRLYSQFDKIKKVVLTLSFTTIALAFILAFTNKDGFSVHVPSILWPFAFMSVLTTALTEYFNKIADEYEIRLNESPENVRAKKLAYDSEIVQFGYISDEFELGLVSMPRKVYNVANAWISRQNRMDTAQVHAILTKEESNALRKSLITGLSLLKTYNTVSRSDIALDSKATQDVFAAFDKLNELISFYEQKEKDSREGKLDTSLSSVDELVSSVVGKPEKAEVIIPDLD